MRRFMTTFIVVGLTLAVTGCGGEGGPASTTPPQMDAAPSQSWATEEASDFAFSRPASDPAEGAGRGTKFDRAEEPKTSEDRAPSREKMPDRRQVRPSGQLTAGSIDDVERPDEFRQFLDRALESPIFHWRVKDVRPRITFHVTTRDGLPVGGAELSIGSARSGRGKVRLMSCSDGRAMLTVSDLDVQTQRGEVTVRPPDGSRPVHRELALDEDVCRIVLDDFQAQRPQQLDLALILDTTGSMGDELEYLKTEIDGIVARLRETFPNVDQRFALIVYRDQGDQYVSRSFDFTRSLDDLRGELSRQHAAGGGDYPEAVHVALRQAAGLDWRPGNVARVAFLVADAPPHDDDAPAAFDATSDLRAAGVRLYPVASSGVELKAELIMRSAAFLTMGQYLFLTDHSGIGNPHATPHTSQYLVEHLDRLMVRMITSELCGRRLQPDDVLAIERGDMELPYGPVPVLPEQQQQWQDANRPSQAASFSLPKGAGLWLTIGAALLGVCVYDSIRARQEA